MLVACGNIFKGIARRAAMRVMAPCTLQGGRDRVG